jgi:hypothetical protein
MSVNTGYRKKVQGYNHEMEYEESYQGRRIIVTTKQGRAGGWTSAAEFMDAEHRVSRASGSEGVYASEEEARRAAFSAAAAAIDRARASRGKP